MFDFCSLEYNNLIGKNTRLYPASRKHEILSLFRIRLLHMRRRCWSFCAIGLLGTCYSMHKQLTFGNQIKVDSWDVASAFCSCTAAKFPGENDKLLSNCDTYTRTLGSTTKRTLPFSSLYNLVSSSCSASSWSTRTCPAILDDPSALGCAGPGLKPQRCLSR